MAKKARRSQPRTAKRIHKKKIARKTKKSASRGVAKAGNPVREQIVAFLQFSHKMFDDRANLIPDHRACEQAGPAQNHRLWIYGHLALTDEWIANLFDGKPRSTPESWDALFGGKSKPVSDQSVYPPFAEVKTAFVRARARLMDAIRKLDDVRLHETIPQDTGGFVSTYADAAIKSGWHEAWHLGHITDLNRGLGLSAK
jgi:hypothetical protein